MANDSQRIINRFGGNAWKGASWAVNFHARFHCSAWVLLITI